MSKRNRMSSDQSTRNFLIILAVMIGGIFLCVGSIIFGSFWMTMRGPGAVADVNELAGPTWPTDSAELTVAVSPVMAPVLAQLADQFNAQNLKTPDGKTMSVQTTVYEPEKMVSAAL